MVKQRKTPPTSKRTAFRDDKDSPGLELLAEAMRNATGDQLRAILKRDRAFTFRLSEMDRETMEKAAKAVGVSVAEYLIRLHYIAYDRLKDALGHEER